MAQARTPGSFRIASQRRAFNYFVDPGLQRAHRVRRILASIQTDIDNGGTARVRQILREPRELYRIELELPELAYQRTTILDRETLTTLLEQTSEQTLRQQFIFR